MSARSDILGRVREALKTPAIKPPQSRSPNQGQDSQSLPLLDDAHRRFLPAVGDSFEERWSVFCKISEKLKTQTHLVSDGAEAQATWKRLAEKFGWKTVAFVDLPVPRGLIGDQEFELYNISQEPFDKHRLASVDVGVTGCDALVAQTASVLVTTHSAGGRSLSALPPHHVVVGLASQMVPVISDGFEILRKKYAEQWPSFISLITGPSRTADIERVLVLGAHGPRNLDVIVIDDRNTEGR